MFELSDRVPLDSAKNKKFVGTNIPTPVFVNNLILAKFVDMTTILIHSL